MIKQWFRHSLRRVVKPVVVELLANDHPNLQESKRIDEISAVDKELQILLQLKYRELLQSKGTLPSFDDVQLRAFSQHGEDGVLLFIFSLVGTTNRRCIEICAGDGIECNTANLIINHGWDGLLVDGNERNVKRGKEFYANCNDTRGWPPKFVHAWITTDSIDQLIRSHNFCGPVDLLSLDIDGNDYWVWEAIEAVEPRVVVLEYQNSWGPDHSVSQRYDPNYVWKPVPGSLGLSGASLRAFVNLGRRKGYRLVGVHSCNAFFIRDGIGDDAIPECPVDDCFDSSISRFNIQRRIDFERLNGSMIGKDWVVV